MSLWKVGNSPNAFSARQYQAHTPKEGLVELEYERLDSDKPGYNLVHFLRVELEA